MVIGRQMDMADHVLEVSDPLSMAVTERDKNVLELVRDALDRQQVMLAYQPIVQTERPDRPVFYEGLIRIMDKSGRVIPAREFIDVVETDEIGRRIDCLALKIGLQALQNEPSLRLAINMSARSIGYKRWMRTLNTGLRHDPKIAERLILEITERSAMLMPDIVQAFMTDLHNLGVAFALDDFGAGYTALRYLKDFYFDILKIDGPFTQGIHQNPDNQVLVRALISIAQHFDMFTVAEMVECEHDAKFLTDAGVDCMQGYYFGMPTLRPYWVQDQEQERKVG